MVSQMWSAEIEGKQEQGWHIHGRLDIIPQFWVHGRDH